MRLTRAVSFATSAMPKYLGNTTNLKQLMKQQMDNMKRVDPSQITLEQVNAAKIPPTSTLATKITQYFICKDMRSLIVVENEGFRCMVNTMEPRYTIPS